MCVCVRVCIVCVCVSTRACAPVVVFVSKEKNFLLMSLMLLQIVKFKS